MDQELRNLVDGEGFNPGDIVVLSPLPFTDSCTSSLPTDLCNSISVLDDASPRNLQRHTIGFAQIRDFKGLESEVIVLVDMPGPGRSEALRASHYVGMSRGARTAEPDLFMMAPGPGLVTHREHPAARRYTFQSYGTVDNDGYNRRFTKILNTS